MGGVANLRASHAAPPFYLPQGRECELFEAALDVVGRCECERGCPACVGPIAEAGPLGKQSARTILAHLVAGGGARERQMG